MPQRGPAHASDPAPDAVRRTTLLLALLLATIAGSVAVMRSRALPPVVVWTLRAADSAGHESLTVHVAPGGDALPGRWILVEDAQASCGSPDGLPNGLPTLPNGLPHGGARGPATADRARAPAVVLVRLRLRAPEDHGRYDTMTRIFGGGEVLYRPSPDPRAAPDTTWHPWRRAGF